ncbi:hypothetical protein HWV62_43824 [Athelia sp. TMB]|nr:hypothetical protein HWV62_43824 [Athelia sp. TMB]
MANTSCSFTSINDVLAQSEAGQLNITTAVSMCQGICTLAWRVGNPDLSGIGMNVCYVFQAILTFLFGPLFCVVYWYREKYTRKTVENLEKLHDTFLDLSAQFSIPVAVAAVVRFLQNPPFYEIAFMHTLLTMQFLSILSTAVTAGIFETRKKPMRIATICLYGLIEFGFYMGLVGGLRTNPARWKAIDQLGDACKAYGTLLPGFKEIPKLHGIVPHVTAKQLFAWSWKGTAAWKAAFTVIGLILAGIVSLAVVAGVIWGLGYLLSSKEIRVLGLISLAFTVGTVVELTQMERTRSLMQAITGTNFGDNQWRFGQVVSLFLWVPICVQAAYYVIQWSLDDPISLPTSSSPPTGANHASLSTKPPS